MRQPSTIAPPWRFFGLRLWVGDLIAGITIAAIAIPEQMATARLGHLPPQIGLLAFVAASLGFFIFGANRSLSVGADSTITPIFAGTLVIGAAGGTSPSLETAAMLALMVGLIVTMAGVCRMGWIANLLSAPVTCGFLAGIALHIVSSQLPVFCGLPAVSGDVLVRLADAGRNLSHANLYAVLLGCLVLLIIVVMEILDRRLPGALVGVGTATACSAVWALQSHGVQVLGTVPPPIPHFMLSWPTIDTIARLAPLALLLAFVVMVQTAATNRAAKRPREETFSLNRDFVGVGVANILAGLAGAFPVNASPPRSLVAAESGARSRAAGLVAAGTVALLALFVMQLFDFVPNAALAAVLLFVAGRIVQFELALQVWRQSKLEFALIIATTLAIVLLPIEAGVATGIGLSLLHGIWTATRSKVIELTRVPRTSVWWPPSPDSPFNNTPGTLVIAFQAPLSFLNADAFRKGVLDRLREAQKPQQLVVLEASSIVEIDFTAAHALREAIDFCRSQGILFAVARLESMRAQDSFRRFGITDIVGNEHFYHSVYEAVEALAPVEAQPE
jgi:MFS superfamily sulfate permease-like transporter